MTQLSSSEQDRCRRLLEAQDKALQLFDEVQARGLVVAGKRESEVSDEIRDLAAELFGVDRHWHKRIVRAGPNTLEPYRVNPPDRVLEPDDIAFLDFGPVFELWEADVGRTYVLGGDTADPVKLRLRDDLAQVWRAGRAHFEATPDITGSQLYEHVLGLATEYGWEFGGAIAGHLVGLFPHEKIDGSDIDSSIAPGSDKPMRTVDRDGRPAHWILEVHLVDRDRQIGGFYEELLDL